MSTRKPPFVMTTAFVVQSSLLLTCTLLVHSVQQQELLELGAPPAPPQAFSSGIKKLPDIYWNSSNPIFRIDNTDHIIDVNQGRPNNLMEYDQVNIVCPLYTNSTKQEDVEQFVIYHVTRDEYDMCRIMNARPHIIAQCNSPYNMRYFTISFRSFSPNPGAIEFRSGKDYYFISTSSKSDLHLRDGGMCRTHNMKLVFKLADGSQQSTQPPLPPPPADPPVKPLQDNQLMNFNTPLPPSLNNLEFSADEKKERRRRRKKERQRNSSFYNSQDHNLDFEEQEDSKYLNDNPQFRQKEMSQVEKVNNLMKQEASSSIFAGHGSKISAPPPVFLFSSILSSFLLLRH